MKKNTLENRINTVKELVLGMKEQDNQDVCLIFSIGEYDPFNDENYWFINPAIENEKSYTYENVYAGMLKAIIKHERLEVHYFYYTEEWMNDVDSMLNDVDSMLNEVDSMLNEVDSMLNDVDSMLNEVYYLMDL